MSSEQNREDRQAASYFPYAPSHSHTRRFALCFGPKQKQLYWAKSLERFGGCWAEKQQPRNEMCGGGDGARFYSASLALVLWRRVKSTTLGRTSLKERADQGRSPAVSAPERAEMMLSEVEIAFYRATTTMETAVTTSLLHLVCG